MAVLNPDKIDIATGFLSKLYTGVLFPFSHCCFHNVQFFCGFKEERIYKDKKTTSFGWFSANLDCSKAHKIIIRFQRSFVVRFSINGMNGSILYDFLSNRSGTI